MFIFNKYLFYKYNTVNKKNNTTEQITSNKSSNL